MQAKRNEFKHESVQDRESIAKYLNALCEGIQKGQLTFKNGDQEIELEPRGLINLEVKIKRLG